MFERLDADAVERLVRPFEFSEPVQVAVATTAFAFVVPLAQPALHMAGETVGREVRLAGRCLIHVHLVGQMINLCQFGKGPQRGRRHLRAIGAGLSAERIQLRTRRQPLGRIGVGIG